MCYTHFSTVFSFLFTTIGSQTVSGSISSILKQHVLNAKEQFEWAVGKQKWEYGGAEGRVCWKRRQAVKETTSFPLGRSGDEANRGHFENRVAHGRCSEEIRLLSEVSLDRMIRMSPFIHVINQLFVWASRKSAFVSAIDRMVGWNEMKLWEEAKGRRCLYRESQSLSETKCKFAHFQCEEVSWTA